MLFGKAVVVAKQLLKSPSEAWHSFAREKKKRKEFQVMHVVLSISDKKKEKKDWLDLWLLVVFR